MKSASGKTLDEITSTLCGELQLPSGQSKSIIINSIASSPESSTHEDIVFIYKQKYFKALSGIKAKALILPDEVKGKISQPSCPVIWVKRPRLVLKKLLELFQVIKKPEPGINPTAIIASTSVVHKTCSIGPFVLVGDNSSIGESTVISSHVYIGSNVKIGRNTSIGPNCSILDDTVIGNNVILHAGVAIGTDGYSYVTEDESNLEKAKKGDFNFNFGRQVQHKIPSTGNIIIEDDVEIGSNTCVDRGTIGSTVIGAGTKVDNLVQIAHNCKIGKDCLIVGQVGFAGSVVLGDRVVVGGQVGFADNINIGNDVIFLARSGVHGEIPSNSVYMGMPAVPYQEHFKNEKAMKRLPRKQEKLEEQIKQLEEKITELEKNLRIGV